MFAWITEQMQAALKRVVIVVHRRELITQVRRALTDAGVHHGVIHGRQHDNTQRVQVAMVNTLANRLDRTPEPDLLIVDEAHHSAAGTWAKIIRTWQSARVLGVTATPERLDGKPLGGDLYEDLIRGPEVADLIRDGYLAEPIYYSIPSSVSGYASRSKEFTGVELDAMMSGATGYDGSDIYGSAAKHYRAYAAGVPAVAFCVNIRHAEQVTQSFRQYGFRWAELHGSMSSEERTDRVEGLASGKYHGLSTVNIVSEGFDLPAIGAAIMLRKTQSLGLYLQQGGRPLRPFAGKKNALIFDHVGNYHAHGGVEEKREWELGQPRKKKPRGNTSLSLRTCPSCFAVHEPAPECPSCGHAYTATARELVEVDGELVRIESGQVQEGYYRCDCGTINRVNTACDHCGHDPVKSAKKAARQEEGMAETLGDLIALGKKRGYKNPSGWAAQKLRGRRRRA